MDVEARNQYLRELREGHSLARKAAKSRLQDEAVQRTGLPHKVMLRKLGHPVTLVRGPRAKRRRTYDAAVAAAWIELWKLLDCPCGRRLAPERRRLHLDQRRGRSLRCRLGEQIPVKMAEEWDRRQVGNLQVDWAPHCGQSTAGRFLWTLSTLDIATHWREGEPVMDRKGAPLKDVEGER